MSEKKRYMVAVMRSDNGCAPEMVGDKGYYDTPEEALKALQAASPNAHERRTDPYWYRGHHSLRIYDTVDQEYIPHYYDSLITRQYHLGDDPADEMP